MNTSVRVLPRSERTEIDHSFIQGTSGTTTLFAGWGPRL